MGPSHRQRAGRLATAGGLLAFWLLLPHPTSASEAGTRATLKVGSTPADCIVHVDGRRYRKTESVLTLGEMPPGRYTVLFERQGRTTEKTVTLEAGGIGFVFADLRARPEDAPSTGALPPTAPPSGEPHAEAEPGPAAEAAPGETIPDADDTFEHAEVLRTAVNPFAKRSRYEEALRLYRKILERWPRSDKVEASRYQIANIHESVFYREYPAAIAMYESVLERNPSTAFPVRWRIAVLYDNRLGKLPEALAWYEQAAAESPSEEIRERAARCARDIRARLAEE